MVDKAWQQGEISASAASEIVVGRRDDYGEIYGNIEDVLVSFAGAHQWRELRACIARYGANCDAMDDREPSDLNGVFLDRVQQRWALTGDLDDLTGHTLDKALKAAIGEPPPGDDR